jgi:hypothetical protein
LDAFLEKMVYQRLFAPWHSIFQVFNGSQNWPKDALKGKTKHISYISGEEKTGFLQNFP